MGFVAVEEVDESSKILVFVEFYRATQEFEQRLYVLVVGLVEKHLTRRWKSVLSNRADAGAGLRAGHMAGVMWWGSLSRLQARIQSAFGAHRPDQKQDEECYQFLHAGFFTAALGES